jgi:hypothetical protein
MTIVSCNLKTDWLHVILSSPAQTNGRFAFGFYCHIHLRLTVYTTVIGTVNCNHESISWLYWSLLKNKD